MVTPFQPRQPVRLIKALSEHLGRVVSAVRSDLYWRFAWPGRYRQRFEQAVTNMSHGICLYDANDRLQLVNEQFCRIYNQPMATLHIGMSFRDMLANSIAIGNYPGLTTDQVWHKRKTFIDQRQPGTFLQELGDGRLIAISHQPLPDGGWVATYEDITERRRAEMQIKFMAEHDALTQLPNRLLFGERLERELAGVKGGGSCCLICLDLDGFKPVNDRLGHAAGDMLLRQVADRLRMNVRVDDVPARLGGDEFAVLLPNTDTAEALAIATRIGAALRCEYDLGAYGPAAIGVSIGVACAARPRRRGRPAAVPRRHCAFMWPNTAARPCPSSTTPSGRRMRPTGARREPNSRAKPIRAVRPALCTAPPRRSATSALRCRWGG